MLDPYVDVDFKHVPEKDKTFGINTAVIENYQIGESLCLNYYNMCNIL